MQTESYTFFPGRRSILAEIYFPERLSTQGRIFKALEDGLRMDHVRDYLIGNVGRISDELSAYKHWFDPNRYGGNRKFPDELSAMKCRMEMWEPVFYGWSTYGMKGVFLKRDGKKIDEEVTQVLRLIFKFDDEESELWAFSAEQPDVYRAILYWVLSEFGHTDDYRAWLKTEERRFLARHPSWPREKKAFAKELYPILVRKIAKWIADSGLFIFGYLVREFWSEVVKLHKERNSPLEDEIWVTSSFHVNVDVMTPYPK